MTNVDIRGGFLETGVKHSGVVESGDFQCFCHYIFETFNDKAKSITR